MPAVDILIPNYNGREALELCIESIARYTPELHRVIVYDDASTNPGDIKYLEKAKGEGWVDTIIRGQKHRGHGTGLNALVGLSAAGPAAYAALIDNDIQILRQGWLSGLLGLASNPRVLIAAMEKTRCGFCSRGYMPGQFLPWFALLNMTGYRDGMSVDWSISEARRADEPWRTAFLSLYPPQDNPTFKHLMATQWEYRADFNAEKVIFDPGCVLWCKMRHENPKGYYHQELTPRVLSCFRHWGHAQDWLEPDNADTERGRHIRNSIVKELERLRCGWR